jgi:hypothetical protein
MSLSLVLCLSLAQSTSRLARHKDASERPTKDQAKAVWGKNGQWARTTSRDWR